MALYSKEELLNLATIANEIAFPAAYPNLNGLPFRVILAGHFMPDFDDYDFSVRASVVRLWACRLAENGDDIDLIEDIVADVDGVENMTRYRFECWKRELYEETRRFIRLGVIAKNKKGELPDITQNTVPKSGKPMFDFITAKTNDEISHDPCKMPRFSASFFGRELLRYHTNSTTYRQAKRTGPVAMARFLAGEGVASEKAFREKQALYDRLLDAYYTFHIRALKRVGEARKARHQRVLRDRRLARERARALGFVENDGFLGVHGKVRVRQAIQGDEEFLRKYLAITTRRSHLDNEKKKARRLDKLVPLLKQLAEAEQAEQAKQAENQ